jgi:hypothetical protein
MNRLLILAIRREEVLLARHPPPEQMGSDPQAHLSGEKADGPM